MARRAFQLAIGLQVAAATQHADRLEPCKQLWILADFFLGQIFGQSMAVTA